jgi:hypothetical protein
MRFINKSWRWLVALGAVFVPAVALGSLTLPYTFVSGTAIKAAEVNANFTAVKTSVDALETGLANKVRMVKGATASWTGSDGSDLYTAFAETAAVALTTQSTVHLSATATADRPDVAGTQITFQFCYRKTSETVHTLPAGGSTQVVHGIQPFYTRVAMNDVIQVPSNDSYVFALCGFDPGSGDYTVSAAAVTAVVAN